jgi:ArsR family transcriptional regulator
MKLPEVAMSDENNEDANRCQCTIIHHQQVNQAKAAEVPVARLLGLAELFKVLGDPSRLRILNALGATELCVCDLATALDMSQSAVSHQLAVLRSARLVRARREGKAMFYNLDDEHVSGMVSLASIHLSEKKDF